MEGDWFVTVGLVNSYRKGMMLTKGVMRGVVGCVGCGRVAIGSCYRERRMARRRRERGSREKREWGERKGGRKSGRKERKKIKAAGNELTQVKPQTLERLGHEYLQLNKEATWPHLRAQPAAWIRHSQVTTNPKSYLPSVASSRLVFFFKFQGSCGNQ